jgi:hypothetical protein
MTVQKESTIVLPLNEGVVEGVVEDVAGGVIVTSDNTRLTKLKGTISRRPKEDFVFSAGVGAVSGGIFPAGRDSSVIYFKPAKGTKRIADASAGIATEDVIGSVTGTAGQNAYFPYPVVDSGVVSGSQLGSTPAICFDDEGRQWTASVRVVSGSTNYGVYVSVIDDGKDAATTQRVANVVCSLGSAFGLLLWCGIVRRSGGVTVFYADDSGYYARNLSLAANGISLVIGAQSLLYVPLKPGVVHYADVVSNGTDTAYVVSRNSGDQTKMEIRKYSLATLAFQYGTTTASAYLSASGVLMNVALQLRTTGGGTYLAHFVSTALADARYGVLQDTGATFNSLWASTIIGEYGHVAIQPHVQGGNEWMVFALGTKVIAGGDISSGPTQITFRRNETVSGAAQPSGFVYWYALQSRGAHHIVSATEVYPYFPIFACWGTDSAEEYPAAPGTTPTDFMIDPSCEVVTPFVHGTDYLMTPVGRFGVDRINMNSDRFQNCSNATAVAPDGRIAFSYIEARPDLSIAAQQASSRYVVWNLIPAEQPAYAFDSGAVAVIAGALPGVWDGVETMEVSPFHTPRVVVKPTGGFGPQLAAGTYNYSAVISYRDAGGNLRRSPPALPFPITLAGATSPIAYVTMPMTMRSGVLQEEFDITIYSTLANGSDYYAQACYRINKGANGGMWRFDDLPTPLVYDVRLYSTGAAGELLLPESPPSAIDIKSIGGRLWLLPGEDRYSVLPSLLKTYGVAYEFNTTLQINAFDPQYGKLVALSDLQGSPIVFAERGIWVISGYGPDNAGRGQSFSDPKLISTQGIRSRESVCQVPGVGVLFQAHDGKFVMLPTGKRYEDFGTYEVGTPTVHLAENEVIYPLKDGSGFIVFNWVADAWVHWPTPFTLPYSAVTTTQSAERSRTLLYSAANGGAYTMDSDSVDEYASQPMKVIRGWIYPSSPQNDCVFHELWLQGLYSGAHGVTLTCEFNYHNIESVTRTWSAAEIADLVVDGKYTLGLNLKATQARAIRVTAQAVQVADVGEAFQPLNLTITYGEAVGVRRRSLRDGSLK